MRRRFRESRVRRRRPGKTTARMSAEVIGLEASTGPGFPGRLTRDSWNRRLTRDSRIPGFFSYKIWKNRKNRFFGLPGPILKFLDLFKVFIYGQYFLYKPLFPSS